MPPNRASGKGSGENRGFVPLPATGLAPRRGTGQLSRSCRWGRDSGFGAGVGLSSQLALMHNRAPRGTFMRVVLPLT